MAINVPVVTKYDPSGLRAAKKGFGDFSVSLKSLAGPAILGAAAAGVGMLVSGITASVKAAAEDARSQRILAKQLVNTTKASAGQIKSVEKFISKTSVATGIVDDELRPAFANLVRGTGSVEKAQKLMTVALDGAAASGKPLNTVVRSLIQAQNGQTASLYKLAPELRKTKGGIDEFAESVKGAAAEAANPFDRLSVLTGELSEKFGALLLPYVEKFVDFLVSDVLPQLDQFLTDIANPETEIGAFWKDLVDSVGKVIDAVKKLIDSDVGQWIIETFGTLTLGTLQFAADKIDNLADALNGLNVAMETYLILTGQKKAPKLGSSENAKKSEEALDTIKGFSFGGLDFAKLFEGFLAQESLKFATGGIVPARRGGTLATVGEAGMAEAIIPLDRLSEFVGSGGGNSYTINVSSMGNGQNVGKQIVEAIKTFERSNGKGWRTA
jgi:hypothetical protein